MGREPRGCGLAATPQLAAGAGPSRAPGDGEEEIRLDTHARTQLGTSLGAAAGWGAPGAGRRP